MSKIDEAIIRLKDALKAHNDDCLLCAIKDTRINESLPFLEAAKAEPGEFTQTIRRVYGITNAKVDKKTPEHGNCCTCQRCGYDHDDCKCLGNDLIELCDRLDAVTAELATVKELHKNEIFKLNDKCVSLRKAQAERIEKLMKFIYDWKDVLLTNMTEEYFEQALKAGAALAEAGKKEE